MLRQQRGSNPYNSEDKLNRAAHAYMYTQTSCHHKDDMRQVRIHLVSIYRYFVFDCCNEIWTFLLAKEQSVNKRF